MIDMVERLKEVLMEQSEHIIKIWKSMIRMNGVFIMEYDKNGGIISRNE